MKQGAAGPKKGSFLRRIFPRRGDGRKEAVRKIALLVLLCIFIGSGAVLLRITILEPMEAQKENDSIRRVYHTAVSEAAPGDAASGGASAAEPAPTFENLKNINKPIRSIFTDSLNNLWIGTNGDGLLRIKNYQKTERKELQNI